VAFLVFHLQQQQQQQQQGCMQQLKVLRCSCWAKCLMQTYAMYDDVTVIEWRMRGETTSTHRRLQS
jgi:hypothetical protein